MLLFLVVADLYVYLDPGFGREKHASSPAMAMVKGMYQLLGY